MTAAPLNVIVLTVDTLRADRLSLYGYDRPTSPRLAGMAQDAIVCDRAFTLGPFTHNACVQIFTSTRPLCFGGYGHGATGRPDTLFKVFRDAGYHTTGISTVHWVSRFFGYDGLEDELMLFTLNTMVGMAVAVMRDTLALYHEKQIGADEMLHDVAPMVRWMFDHADEFCDVQMENQGANRRDFPNTILVDAAYDYRKVKRVTHRHREAFASNPLAYVERHLNDIPASHEWIAGEWRYCRPYAKLVSEGAFRAANTLLARLNPRLARRRKSRTKYYPDAMSLANKVVATARQREPSKPFFIWAHFKDTHMPYVSGYGRNWYEETPSRLAALGYRRDLDAPITFRPERPRNDEEMALYSSLYDAAVHSTDEAIGYIADSVDRLGLGENTLIAICADHGEEFGEHGDHEHSCLFYEHNVRVPMLFRRQGLAARRIGNLTSLLDFAPTIVTLAGLEAPAGWEGRPVTEQRTEANQHIVMETFCRGSCIFEHRPMYLGVRTTTHKYMWKEYRDRNDRYSCDGHELYDLTTDPEERNNLYRDDHPTIIELSPLIANRLAQIPQISDQRIISAFGDIGRAAINKFRTADKS